MSDKYDFIYGRSIEELLSREPILLKMACALRLLRGGAAFVEPTEKVARLIAQAPNLSESDMKELAATLATVRSAWLAIELAHDNFISASVRTTMLESFATRALRTNPNAPIQTPMEFMMAFNDAGLLVTAEEKRWDGFVPVDPSMSLDLRSGDFLCLTANLQSGGPKGTTRVVTEMSVRRSDGNKGPDGTVVPAGRQD